MAEGKVGAKIKYNNFYKDGFFFLFMGIDLKFVCGACEDEDNWRIYRSGKEDGEILVFKCEDVFSSDKVNVFLNDGSVYLFGVEKTGSLLEGMSVYSSAAGEKWLKDNGHSVDDLGSFIYEMVENI